MFSVVFVRFCSGLPLITDSFCLWRGYPERYKLIKFLLLLSLVLKVRVVVGPFRVPPGLCMKTRLSAQPFIFKWFFILMQIKLIFIRKVVHLASFWKWGFLELGSGLLRLGDKRDGELTWVKKKNYLNLILTRRGPFILFWCYRPML